MSNAFALLYDAEDKKQEKQTVHQKKMQSQLSKKERRKQKAKEREGVVASVLPVCISNEPFYRCPCCKSICNSEDQYNDHVASKKHKSNSNGYCFKCNAKFPNQQALITHVQQAHVAAVLDASPRTLQQKSAESNFQNFQSSAQYQQAATMTSAALPAAAADGKGCSWCGSVLPKSSYSKNQWKKGAERKCSPCTSKAEAMLDATAAAPCVPPARSQLPTSRDIPIMIEDDSYESDAMYARNLQAQEEREMSRALAAVRLAKTAPKPSKKKQSLWGGDAPVEQQRKPAPVNYAAEGYPPPGQYVAPGGRPAHANGQASGFTTVPSRGHGHAPPVPHGALAHHHNNGPPPAVFRPPPSAGAFGPLASAPTDMHTTTSWAGGRNREQNRGEDFPTLSGAPAPVASPPLTTAVPQHRIGGEKEKKPKKNPAKKSMATAVKSTRKSTPEQRAADAFVAAPKVKSFAGVTARKAQLQKDKALVELHTAINAGDTRAAIDALKDGSSPNKPNPETEWEPIIPLALAAQNGNEHVVRCLLACKKLKVGNTYTYEGGAFSSLDAALKAWRRAKGKRGKEDLAVAERIVKLIMWHPAQSADAVSKSLDDDRWAGDDMDAFR